MRNSTPLGFRDVLSDEAVVRERLLSQVQSLFADAGYLPVETPTLEVMSVLEAAGPLSSSSFKFFDSEGELLSLRPDVTLQIARLYATRLAGEMSGAKLRYALPTFRETDTDTYSAARQLTQVGIECIGKDGWKADLEIVELFCRALKAAGVANFTCVIATVGVLRALLERSGADHLWKEAVLDAYHRSDYVTLDRLTQFEDCPEGSDVTVIAPAYARAIQELPRVRGGLEAIERVEALVEPLGCLDGLDDLKKTYEALIEQGFGDHLMIDFSVMCSFDYYTGIVFEAYGPTLGSPLGSGGRYDKLISSFGADAPAAGFSFYLEQAMAVPSDVVAKEDRPLRIAVPKGALNADSLKLLSAAGVDIEGLDHPGRSLMIRNGDVEFIIVRPSDAPVFVALGSADCGICGKDSLLEAAVDVVELVDLGFGECRFVVAEPEGAAERVAERYRRLGSIRIATKYPRITLDHFARNATSVEIVKLHGNIELAPLTGMAERIVDITATGNTLRENHLVVVDEILSSTARFFANRCTFRTDGRIRELAQKFGRLDRSNFEPIAGQPL